MSVEKVDFEENILIPELNKTQKESLEKAIMEAVNK
jgi:hypothetical protein